MNRKAVSFESLVTCSIEYKRAREKNLPCVALESSVVAQGLPYRHNLEAIRNCEEVIRREGAVPVTMGVWEGKIVAGMSSEQIEHFARRPDKVRKVNVQNLASVIACPYHGATTVSATVHLAARLGIPIMATGGIGGVHLNMKEIMDVSSDLQALASYPVAVVSSGAKCVLDIPKTLEVMETLGVPVIGYRTDYFPLFYSNKNLYPLETSFSHSVDIVNYLRYYFSVFPESGVLIANSVPEKHSFDYGEINRIVQRLLQEAQKKSIKGKELTPYLLKNLAVATNGQSVLLNKELLVKNARLAASIAKGMV